MPMVCSGNPPVCVWVDEPESTAPNGGTATGGTQAATQAAGGERNVPTGGSVLDTGETGQTAAQAPAVATVPASSPTPEGALVIPNYNMNVFIAVAIIVAGFGIGFYLGRR